MRYLIESGIPLPPPAAGGQRKSELRVAIESMKPGDSMLVSRRVKRETIYSAARRNNFKMATRKVDAETVRVWRVK